MKQSLLFILFSFIATIGQAQDISSVVIYDFDEMKQQYVPDGKYIYDHDEEDPSRLRAYDRFSFNEDDATWELTQHLVRDFNEHDHLVYAVLVNYKGGSTKSRSDIKYSITYDYDGTIAAASADRYEESKGGWTTTILKGEQLTRVTNYHPIYNRFAPSYLAEHGIDLQYDKNNKLIYGQLSKCRLQEYTYTYGVDGRATQVIINRIGKTGLMEKQSKVILNYDHISERVVSTDINIAAFPNPTKDIVTIQLDRATDEIQELLLTDLFGRLIRTISVEAFQIEKIIDVSDLAAGIYLLTAEAGGTSTQVVKID